MMKLMEEISLNQIQEVYSGPEGELWELMMGEQIHIGGLSSSMELARKAGIHANMEGIDLCCCTGAGMRFLVRFMHVRNMVGVDFTEKVISKGIERNEQEGVSDRIRFQLAEATETDLPSGMADFVWGEDAWCYVEDKAKLIAEAVRLLKPGGIIAFTDWLEAYPGLNSSEMKRLLKFMKFPNMEDIEGYKNLLMKNGCEVLVAEDTRQFIPHINLYVDMVNKQKTYDALKIIGFDAILLRKIASEMVFMQELAWAEKIVQGRFVARKK